MTNRLSAKSSITLLDDCATQGSIVFVHSIEDPAVELKQVIKQRDNPCLFKVQVTMLSKYFFCS